MPLSSFVGPPSPTYSKSIRVRIELRIVDRERIIRYANRKRIKGLTFRRGERVYLATRNLKTNRLSIKLNFKYEGLFEVEK